MPSGLRSIRSPGSPRFLLYWMHTDMENSLPERAVKEVLTSAKRIVTPGSYDASKGLSYHIGNEAGEGIVRMVEEPMRLAALTVGFLAKTTWNQISSLIGSTVRLTGRAIVHTPLFAAPASPASASRRGQERSTLAA